MSVEYNYSHGIQLAIVDEILQSIWILLSVFLKYYNIMKYYETIYLPV